MKEKISPFSGTKILRFPDRIAAWKEGLNPPPINISLDLTYACGHRCPACTGDPEWRAGRKNEELKDEEWMEVISDLSAYGVRSITFVGAGDTMARPGAEKFVVHAKESGMDVGMITNGQVMSEKQARLLVPVLSWIRISLDADGPEMFKQTHGMPADEFEKTMSHIRLLADVKRETASECVVGVGYLTGRKTKRGMVEATEIVKATGADYIQFRPFNNENTPIDDILLICKEYENDTFRVLCSRPKYDSINNDEPRGYDNCYGQQFFSQIDPNGNVVICCEHKGQEEYVLGNLRQQTFREIWEGEQRQKVLAGFDFKGCPKYCRGHPINRLLQEVVSSSGHDTFL